MPVVTKEDKIRFAATMINDGRISTINHLYKYLPKKVVAEILGVNSTRFSNMKSNHPEDFKMSEINKLSKALDIELFTMVNIFKNSLVESEAIHI